MSPTTSRPHPTGSARRTPTIGVSDCPAVEARNTEKTTAPVTARLCTSRVVATKLGATAVNSPSSAKPAKAATDAGTNTPLTSSGTLTPCGLSGGHLFGCSTVSGSDQVIRHPTAISPRCTQKTSVNGRGAYCASRPDSSGPQPRPPMFAAVAANPARALRPGRASSMTAAVAAPLSSPAATPESSRPAKSRGRPRSSRAARARGGEGHGGQEHGPSAHVVGVVAGHQEHGDDGEGVDGEHQRDDQLGEADLLLVEAVQGVGRVVPAMPIANTAAAAR